MNNIKKLIKQHVPIKPTTKDEWNKAIVEKSNKFGQKKVNINIDGETEGLWATPDSQESLDIYNSNESGYAIMYLLNFPLSFGFWGMPVLVKLGVNRPEVFTPTEMKEHPKLIEEIEYLFALMKSFAGENK